MKDLVVLIVSTGGHHGWSQGECRFLGHMLSISNQGSLWSHVQEQVVRIQGLNSPGVSQGCIHAKCDLRGICFQAHSSGSQRPHKLPMEQLVSTEMKEPWNSERAPKTEAINLKMMSHLSCCIILRGEVVNQSSLKGWELHKLEVTVPFSEGCLPHLAHISRTLTTSSSGFIPCQFFIPIRHSPIKLFQFLKCFTFSFVSRHGTGCSVFSLFG